MNRKRIGYAVVGLLAVLAVALSATALTEQPVAGGGEPGTGEEPTGPPVSFDETNVEFVTPLKVFVVLLWALLAVAAYGALREPLRTLKQFLVSLVALSFLLVVLYLAIRFLAGRDDGGQEGAARNNTSGGGLGGGETGGIGSSGTEGVETVLPEPALFVVLVVVVLGIGLAAAVIHQRTFDGEYGDEGDEARLAAIGRSAGAAADRIAADADVDNEVYRAWKEMTGHLDLENPDSRTPEEFRTAAVEAGMTAADVDDLTDLFAQVRYGGSTPTEEREELAREALRRIERRYAEGST